MARQAERGGSGAGAVGFKKKKSAQPSLAEAQRRLYDAVKLVPKKLMAAQELDIRRDKVNALQANIEAIEAKIAASQAESAKARYNVEHVTVMAPPMVM